MAGTMVLGWPCLESIMSDWGPRGSWRDRGSVEDVAVWRTYDSDDGLADAGEGRGGGLWEAEGCVVAS